MRSPREHVVDELDRALLADRERGQRVGEGDRVAQRQHAAARSGSAGCAGDRDRRARRGRALRPRSLRSAAGSHRHRRRLASARSDAESPAGRRERQLDAQDAVLVAWPWPRSARTSAPSSTIRRNGPARSRPAGRRGPRLGRAARPAEDQLAALDLEAQRVELDAGELGLDDRARRIGRVVDVDGGREAARSAARPGRCVRRRLRTARPSRAACARSWRTGRARGHGCNRSSDGLGRRPSRSDLVDGALARELDRRRRTPRPRSARHAVGVELVGDVGEHEAARAGAAARARRPRRASGARARRSRSGRGSVASMISRSVSRANSTSSSLGPQSAP